MSRGRGVEGSRGRGVEGSRGRGVEGSRGRGVDSTQLGPASALVVCISLSCPPWFCPSISALAYLSSSSPVLPKAS